MVTFESIRQDDAVNTYIRRADESLLSMGYTEHSFSHVCRVADNAERILRALGHDDHTIELAKIAAYLHDIGNLVNRVDHSQSGAVMAFRILEEKGMPPEDIATVVTAIGNHDEGTGVPVNPVAAALILADKTDVRRSRVRNANPASFDIHDRVNCSVSDSLLSVYTNRREIVLSLTIDVAMSPVIDYFEIFLERMNMCRRAADALDYSFRLFANGQPLL